MEGPPAIDFGNKAEAHNLGVIPRSLIKVFELTEQRRENGWKVSSALVYIVTLFGNMILLSLCFAFLLMVLCSHILVLSGGKLP